MKKCVCGVWLYLLSLGMWGCALDEEVAAEEACEGTECESDVACTRSVCVGSTAHICINGSVFVRFCEYGCNAESGSCREPSCNPDLLCTENTCEGNILKICNGGKVVLTKDCGAAGCNPMTGMCNSNGEVGTACDRSTYKQTCINNGANALVCWDDVVTKWDCSGGCLDAGYDPAKPLQVNCWRSLPCGVDPSNTFPNPKGDSTVAGASCDASTYYGACSDDFTKRYYCDKASGQVVEKDCASGCDPASLGNNSSKCKSGVNDGGNESDVPDCAPGGTVYCKKACKAGGSEGYYYSKGEVHIVTCANNDCTTASGKVECASDTIAEGGNEGDACNRQTYKQTCINGGANALVCWDDVVTKWTCANSECMDAGHDHEKPLQVSCKKPNGIDSTTACTGDTVTEGGVVGQCCDSEQYKPAGCDPETNSGLRCSDGIIKEWACPDGLTCSYHPVKNWYSCK
ncbi:MAG: hypothetical protein IJ268_06625 [Proteobacteria bacterium]|nr:hypothetical protein [Pseudomonadota bacterium]